MEAGHDVGDIDPERCAVFVKRGKGGKDRWSPLDTHTVSVIQTVVKERGMGQEERFVDFCKRTMQRHVAAIAEKAQIPWNTTCHSLRHTCATWQLDKGMPLEVVKENLGHSDILTTRIYLHMNIRQRSRAYRDATRFGI